MKTRKPMTNLVTTLFMVTSIVGNTALVKTNVVTAEARDYSIEINFRDADPDKDTLYLVIDGKEVDMGDTLELYSPGLTSSVLPISIVQFYPNATACYTKSDETGIVNCTGWVRRSEPL